MAKCRAVPDGPHEATRLFERDMTPADQAAADDFMQRYRRWKRNVSDWEAYINGAAPYWSGPRPRWPGRPPRPPRITNTACQAAAAVGVARIFRALKAQLATEFRCQGDCPRGKQCRQVFSRHRGRGYSLTAKKTYCEFTMTGDCRCRPAVEA